MDYSSVLETEVRERNPWWSSGRVDLHGKMVRRDIFEALEKLMDEREILGLIGLRRTGKTVLMHQMIDALLEKGEDAKNILYFSFDKQIFHNAEAIADVIRFHKEDILAGKSTKRAYVFLDEVHNIGGWASEVKNTYDKDRSIKFIVSGSSSLGILSGSGEALVGRIVAKKVFPFSFREFLRSEGIEIKSKATRLSDEEFDGLKREAMPYEKKVRACFKKYVEQGGFPEVILSENKDLAGERIKSWVYFTLFRDIVDTFRINRPEVLENLMTYIAMETGQTANYTRMASSLKVKYDTLKSYISYLEQSFLVTSSKFFSRGAKVAEKNEKLYLSDVGLLKVFGYPDEGLVVENAIVSACKALRYRSEGDEKTSYWKGKGEVDIVLSLKGNTVPIEVKYRRTISDKDSLPLREFMETNKVRRSIMVTKEDYGHIKTPKGNILLVPAWLFLLIA